MSQKAFRDTNDISDATNSMLSSCLICRAALSDDKIRVKDFINNIEGIFNYIRCSECGSYMQSPIPSQKYLNTCYKSKSLDYFHIPEKEILLNQSKSGAFCGNRTWL